MSDKGPLLEGKCAVVTGGASGIGAASARALNRAGAAVAIFDLDVGKASEIADSLTEGRAYAVDVADAEAVEGAFEAALGAFGRLDILVNNAGIGTTNTLMNMPLDDWRRVIDVNLSGQFYCMKSALAALQRQGGSIINIASIAGKRISYHGGVNYTASKAGVLGLTRHAAFELAQYNIRVNAICPGPVMTPMIEAVSTPEQQAKAAEMIPLGAWLKPENIADMVVFLASPQSVMCTGASFDVDGGMLVSNGIPYDDYMAHRNRENQDQ